MNMSEMDRMVLQTLSLAMAGTAQVLRPAPRECYANERGKVGINRPKKKKKFGKKKK